jgi:protease-4
LTSELIWRELELTNKEVPLVVSMGDYAASGGYYLACNADRIFAEPTTITGSIGVFGTIPNISGFVDDIGINAEQVHTNKGAYYSLFEPMSDDFRAFAVQGVEQVYTTFLTRVSEGRDMTIEEVNAIAQGRVWSGTEAVQNGLVDELGSLEDAIAHAAELAGVDSYSVRNYPSYKVDLEDRFSLFPFAKSNEEIISETFGQAYAKIFQTFKTFGSQPGVQARIPYLIHIE